MGYLKPTSGTITFQGTALVGLPTHAIAGRGLAFSPEESAIFGDLTVGGEHRDRHVDARLEPSGAERDGGRLRVFPRLRGYARRGGTQLSGGERKMLSIARALALDPEMCCSWTSRSRDSRPRSSRSISQSITDIVASGRAMLLAESNIDHVPDNATRLYVIERGEIVFAGTPLDARRDPAVLKIIGAPPSRLVAA
jgi:branched-chain amino acid transport system ATP-binding protein